MLSDYSVEKCDSRWIIWSKNVGYSSIFVYSYIISVAIILVTRVFLKMENDIDSTYLFKSVFSVPIQLFSEFCNSSAETLNVSVLELISSPCHS